MSHNTFSSMLEYTLPFQKAHWIKEAIAPAIPTILDQVAQKFNASLKPEAIKSFNGRLERGLELAKNGAVQSIPDAAHPRRFKVRSSDGSQFYMVDLDARSCECPDSVKGHSCKHRIAAYLVEQAQKVKATTVQNTPSPRPAVVIRPTCSVPPPQEEKVQPTCTIPPTRTEFERAEKRAQPNRATDNQPAPRRTEKEILAELGFDPESRSKVKEQTPQLGTLYRRYLHGSDLGQQALPVTIRDITKERVCPHPSQPVIEKWCLWVDSLPAGIANGILFGSRGEDDLTAIFGKVDIHELKGKQVVIYPKPMNVAGQPKVSIRFRGVQ